MLVVIAITKFDHVRQLLFEESPCDGNVDHNEGTERDDYDWYHIAGHIG